MAESLRVSRGLQYGHTSDGTSDGGLEVRLSAYELLSAIIYDDDNDTSTPPAAHTSESLRSPAFTHFDLPEPHVDAKKHLLGDLLVQPKRIVRRTTQVRRKIPEIYDRVVRHLFPRYRAKSRTPEVSEASSLESEFFIIHVDHDCVICRDTIEGTQIRAPCGHYFDRECLISLVEASTRDESMFPPRCCQQHIPQSTFEPYMATALATIYTEKSDEFSTLKRVYCANPSCSRFLGPRTNSIIPCALPCPSCSATTCNRCRSRVTSGVKHKCTNSQSHREVLALANSKGWARCPTCGQMIELRSGCYHMTCVCATQFCYLCRAPWKTCECSQWERLPRYEFDALELPNFLGIHRAFTRRRRPPTPPPEPPQPSPQLPVPELPALFSRISRPPSVVHQTPYSHIHERPLPRPPKEPPEDSETPWECGTESPHAAFVLARGVQAQVRRQERKRTLGRRRGWGTYIERRSIVSLDPLLSQRSNSLRQFGS
ncbi:hypothetical protein B0H21DRAFT_30326 [Amylocystis lapponica]|nr:hypothetical protein B0H21DRAFT_30326 [Amylocystis lapponica]